MLAKVTDTCIQVHGGMGLMDDLPFKVLERRRVEEFGMEHQKFKGTLSQENS